MLVIIEEALTTCGTSEDVMYFNTPERRCVVRPTGYLLATLRFFGVAGHTKRMFVFEMTEKITSTTCLIFKSSVCYQLLPVGCKRQFLLTEVHRQLPTYCARSAI